MYKLSKFILLSVILLLTFQPVSAVTTIISPGNDVFMGEEGLDISRAVPAPYDGIAYFGPGTSPYIDVPTMTVPVTNSHAFYISPFQFEYYTGNWYQWDSRAGRPGSLAFVVKEPRCTVRVYDNKGGTDITNSAIMRGGFVNFRVETNLNTVTSRIGYNPVTDGFVDLHLITPGGGEISAVRGAGGRKISLQDLSVNTVPWYLVPLRSSDGWNTAASDSGGNLLYEFGTYQVKPEISLNDLDNNYSGWPGFVSSSTVTIGSDRVSIEANRDTVVRGNPFSVTISGSPNTEYYLWVEDTGSMSGKRGDQPPMILFSQEDIRQDSQTGPYLIGLYQFNNRDTTIKEDVPSTPYSGVKYYALVKTDDSGKRTVEWRTTEDTREKRYRFRVERRSGNMIRSDEVDVKVDKGSVTVVTAPADTFYLGEEVRLSGTNTESSDTYLFITGPNLPHNGGKLTDPTRRVVDGDISSFTVAGEDDYDTWEYKWQTGGLGIDAGAYTIYAVGQPVGRNSLSGVPYKAISINLKRPFVSTTASSRVIAKGDSLYITGTGSGDPDAGVAIWIFGRNLVFYDTETVNDDGTFEYELDKGMTDNMFAGQYEVVVQHPMYNREYDVYPDGSMHEVLGKYPYPGATLFRISGPGALDSSSAAYALVKELDSPYIDDTYVKLSFVITNPKIEIDTIEQKLIGQKFTITGRTNLGTDNELLVEVTEALFKPTKKWESGAFYGVSGTVKPEPGPEGWNMFSFPVDTTWFEPGEYMVMVSGVSVDATDSTIVAIVEPTPLPTQIIIEPPAVITTQTTLPTVKPTTIPVTQITTVPVTPAKSITEKIPLFVWVNAERIVFISAIILLILLLIVQWRKSRVYEEEVEEEE